MEDRPCELCGRVPTVELTLRRQVGMLLLMRTYRYRGPLCRDHGIENAKEFLSKTLVQGWWGLFSFFVNFFVIATDLIALRKAKQLPPPR
jgi:hypothetical protein